MAKTSEETLPLEPLVELLGGPRLLGARADLIEAVRSGLPFRAFASLTAALDIEPMDVWVVMGVSKRTAARRKGKILSSVESDRLLRIARIFVRAIEVLGSEAKARSWFFRENRALGQKVPFQLLDTDFGTRYVEDALGRIEHGVFA